MKARGDSELMQRPTIVVLGESGQLSLSLKRLIEMQPSSTLNWIFLSRRAADLEDPTSVCRLLAELKPSLLINTAAYTAVDLAESEPSKAMQINGTAVGELARFCATAEIPFIHFSSDYVYSGSGDQPHLENEAIAPTNVYGESKALGDRLIAESGARALIFRTSWVYSPFGKNFVRTMLALGAAREDLAVVSDQIGSPTSALDLARAVSFIASEVLTSRKPFSAWGTYHMAGAGETSWFEFAKEVFRQAQALGMPLQIKHLRALPTRDYKTPAKRPLNSRLNQDRLLQVFGYRLPPWQSGLAECLEYLK